MMPTAWYILLAIVSFCGVGAWYIRNFTQRVDLLRIFAFTGSIAMGALLIWTWKMDI
ncbi:MAG: hypothetical protein HOE92_03790 [Euryarchaeota archaeon]|jgi:hypothetical protein|nr:hypothetical protein [Euryarchaeota archaeon]MBT3971323.1 hypothetical protein [Euryarchaeota archaeon]MBT4408188.1 hypothetical protein [Euryarchaeota archaeon]MBT6644407.1 hypothetical protein [Euryarchaeota archaeon]